MKILKLIMVATVLLLMPGYAFSSNLGYMRISLLEGDIQIKTPETGEWALASINAPLAEGDQVWVPEDGRVELQLNSGTYLRLDQGTAIQILSMDKDSSQFYLSQGKVYVYYDAPRGNVIQMDTPDTSTRAFSRTIFRIDISDQYADVSVYKGYVETENKIGNTRVNAGQMLSLGQDMNAELAPMGPSDEWEAWNKERNARTFTSSGKTSRYLPPELRAYSYDLESNGRWVQVPEYGYVWTPTVVVSTSWTPYREGRWTWRGGEYVWIASEPWGWAPYHYGRWSFFARIGWCWVPPVRGEVYWGPGYVGWVRTADYVAWVPLAPGEIYYGRGYYGKHSVNITNVNINQINIAKVGALSTNVYKNVHVTNGVTVVKHNTFNTGSPTIVNLDKNIIQQKIFVKNNISAGAPDIKPSKTNYFVPARQLPAAKLPPKSLSNMAIKDLKNSRPFIKEPARSVINPGIKPQALPVNTVATPRSTSKGKPMIQPVQPAEKPRTDTTEVKPMPRIDKQPFKPTERAKPAFPESTTLPKAEKQQSKSTEKNQSVSHEGNTLPKSEKSQVKPVDKGKPVSHESITIPKVEKQQPKPAERAKEGALSTKAISPEVTTKKALQPAEGSQKSQKKQDAEVIEK